MPNMEFVHLDNIGVSLPYPLTDFSIASTLNPIGHGDRVLSLFGGCFSSYASQFKTLDTFTAIEYVCRDVTDANLMFVQANEEIIQERAIQQRAPMPRPRYRHSSVSIHGRTWIVGGRDASNNIIEEIDVYDELNDEWTTLNGEAFINYGVSDHCVFTNGSNMFIVGGYDRSFNAVRNTIMINTEKSWEEGILNLQVLALMNQARAGCGATTTIAQNALVAGGFTHEDGYCEAITSAEMYYPRENKWEMVEHDMRFGRAKPGLLRFGHEVYVFGGEKRGVHDLNGECHGDPYSLGFYEDLHLPNRLTYPVDSVEVFNFGDDYDEAWHVHNSKWVLLQSKVDKIKGSYGYIAASINSSLYFFGGVKNHNSAIEKQYSQPTQAKCEECFKISTRISVYERSGRNVASYVDEYTIYILAMICITIAISLFVCNCRRIRAKKRLEQEKEEHDSMILEELSWTETDDEPN